MSQVLHDFEKNDEEITVHTKLGTFFLIFKLVHTWYFATRCTLQQQHCDAARRPANHMVDIHNNITHLEKSKNRIAVNNSFI